MEILNQNFEFSFSFPNIEPYDVPKNTEFFNVLRFDEIELIFKNADLEYRGSFIAPEIFDFFRDFISWRSKGEPEFRKELRESGESLAISKDNSDFVFVFFSYPQQTMLGVRFGKRELLEYLTAFVAKYDNVTSEVILNKSVVPQLNLEIERFKKSLRSF